MMIMMMVMLIMRKRMMRMMILRMQTLTLTMVFQAAGQQARIKTGRKKNQMKMITVMMIWISRMKMTLIIRRNLRVESMVRLDVISNLSENVSR
uniref:Protein CHROMATIN REMODELING 5 n=1 Tax=Rhizophora mucronata TaxID=61149 RepID=A0A2P2MF14_RHIMU